MRTALLCLFAVLLTATTCKANPCVCLKTSNPKIPPSVIKNYYIQKSGLCHITAAVLSTVRGRRICADPNMPWVIKAMRLVDGKRRTDSTTASSTSSTSTASACTVITTGGSYNTS